jgi:hypothetical protein
VYVLDLRAARAHGGHRTRLRQQPMAQGSRAPPAGLSTQQPEAEEPAALTVLGSQAQGHRWSSLHSWWPRPADTPATGLANLLWAPGRHRACPCHLCCTRSRGGLPRSCRIAEHSEVASGGGGRRRRWLAGTGGRHLLLHQSAAGATAAWWESPVPGALVTCVDSPAARKAMGRGCQRERGLKSRSCLCGLRPCPGWQGKLTRLWQGCVCAAERMGKTWSQGQSKECSFPSSRVLGGWAQSGRIRAPVGTESTEFRGLDPAEQAVSITQTL